MGASDASYTISRESYNLIHKQLETNLAEGVFENEAEVTHDKDGTTELWFSDLDHGADIDMESFFTHLLISYDHEWQDSMEYSAGELYCRPTAESLGSTAESLGEIERINDNTHSPKDEFKLVDINIIAQFLDDNDIAGLRAFTAIKKAHLEPYPSTAQYPVDKPLMLYQAIKYGFKEVSQAILETDHGIDGNTMVNNESVVEKGRAEMPDVFIPYYEVLTIKESVTIRHGKEDTSLSL